MAGAAGYVLKQIRANDLVDAVRRVAAGQNLLDPAVTAKVLERLRHGPEEDELIARLSPQERQVLLLLADGLTNGQIAERLYLAEKTIKNPERVPACADQVGRRIRERWPVERTAFGTSRDVRPSVNGTRRETMLVRLPRQRGHKEEER